MEWGGVVRDLGRGVVETRSVSAALQRIALEAFLMAFHFCVTAEASGTRVAFLLELANVLDAMPESAARGATR
jgi:hypothetical protein